VGLTGPEVARTFVKRRDMTKQYVYLTRRIGAEGDAARDVAAIVVSPSGASHAEAAAIAAKHQLEILGGSFHGKSLCDLVPGEEDRLCLFEVINEPTVEEAKKAYRDAVNRYRAVVAPTKEELDRAETYLSDFDNEKAYRHRRNQNRSWSGVR
jgi:hypothetical protein